MLQISTTKWNELQVRANFVICSLLNLVIWWIQKGSNCAVGVFRAHNW